LFRAAITIKTGSGKAILGESRAIRKLTNPTGLPCYRKCDAKLKTFFGGTVAKVTEIDPAKLRGDIDKCLDQMKEIFADLKRPTMQGWKVEHINVGLTISAEGSVGVATAGVEASIEIGFAPEK
jgi:hypothetical protein